jgi:two-component system CheB/CheR fusion protein
MTPESLDLEFDALLDYLRRTRGFDFSAYKRPSLVRRVQKRMQHLNVERFADYTDHLEVHPEEFGQLFDVILINVTSFFRDEIAWDYLRETVVPSMLAARTSDPLRIWTAACASGEEAYSIAMLLAEALGRAHFRDRVKIYATDIDEQALNEARTASYTEKQIEAVPRDWLAKYFVQEGERYVFDKELRRSVIFGRHDLIQDAPISRVSLLLCRNALMYFNNEAQSRLLARFHFALAEHGILFLGKAEMLLTHSALFTPIDLRRRIFRKVMKDDWRDRLATMAQSAGDGGGNGAAGRNVILPSACDVSPTPQFILDSGGLLAMFNDRAKGLFGFVPTDVGRPFQDLEVSYRPAELRSVVADVVEHHGPALLRDVQWDGPGRNTRFVDIHVVPVHDAGGHALGVSVSFTDVSRVQELEMQLHRSRQDLETAYEELQSTNEELETTNEELQSTGEELETTNEELQSTNEELETMNEELQSTNEELQTLNEELRERSEDYTRANSFLESILTGVRTGVVVVDRELRVVAWNNRSEDLWGLRADEVRSQNFLNLEIGLPTDQLRHPIRECLNGGGEHIEASVLATNRRGKTITCKVTVSPLLGSERDIRGAILLIEDQSMLAPH